jgi:hypothetical protein
MPVITITFFLTSAVLIVGSKILDKSKIGKILICLLLQYMHDLIFWLLKAVAKIIISFANLIEFTKTGLVQFGGNTK